MVAKKKIAKKKVVSEAPKKTNYRFAIIVLILFLALCAVLVFFLTRPAPDYSYNGYPFIKTVCPGTERTCYSAELNIQSQLYSMMFYYHPTEVENVLFEYTALEALRNAREKPNPKVIMGLPDGAPGELGIAGSQLGRVLGTRYGILNFEVEAKVIGIGDDKVDCDDARTNVVVVAFKQGDVDAISVPSPNCIVVSAVSPERAIAVSDAFVYRILGVMRTVRDAPTAVAVSDGVVVVDDTGAAN